MTERKIEDVEHATHIIMGASTITAGWDLICMLDAARFILNRQQAQSDSLLARVAELENNLSVLQYFDCGNCTHVMLIETVLYVGEHVFCRK